MKYITAAVALVFLAIVADDIAYVVARRSDFRPEDVTRHLEFHAFVLAAVAWHSYLTARAWLNAARVHLKLLVSLISLVACIGTFLLLAPAFEKGSAFDGGSSIPSIVLHIAFLAAGFVLVYWSWRVSDAQSGKGRRLTGPPHTTRHADPHRAVQEQGAHDVLKRNREP